MAEPAKRAVNIAESFGSVGGAGESVSVGRLDSHDIRLVRLKAQDRWRQHFNADEMFLVVGGSMRMHFRDRIEDVAQGAFIVVPAGVEHRAEALTPECQVVQFAKPEAS